VILPQGDYGSSAFGTCAGTFAFLSPGFLMRYWDAKKRLRKTWWQSLVSTLRQQHFAEVRNTAALGVNDGSIAFRQPNGQTHVFLQMSTA
jgi:hypothetical protein